MSYFINDIEGHETLFLKIFSHYFIPQRNNTCRGSIYVKKDKKLEMYQKAQCPKNAAQDLRSAQSLVT